MDTRANPAAKPVPCVAADDTPSKSRTNRIRLEKGESVAVAQGDVDRAFLTLTREDSTPEEIEARMFLMRHIADHARIVAELRDSVDVAQQEIDELRLHNSKQEASLAACRADAERWQWLRRNASGGTIFCGGLPGGALNCDEPETEWDAAIDAARSQP